jgi:tetratricopeptide (TPR) repeat protein
VPTNPRPTTPRPGLRAPRFLRPLAGSLLTGIIFIAPLAIGTVHAWARTVVFLLVALLLGVTLVERAMSMKRPPLTVPLLALGVAALATAFQLVPLPAAVLRVISPRADEIFSAILGDYGAHAITLDPAGTVAELAKLLAYAAFFLAAVVYASRTHRRRQLLMAVVGVAVVETLIGMAQALVGTHKLLFVYEPVARGVNDVLVRGTFVNGNHYGALMCLASACALGLGLRETRYRAPLFVATALINVGAVLSLSRAAMIATPLAQILTFALDRWQLRHDGEERGQRAAGLGLRLGLAGLAVAALVMGVSLASNRVGSTLAATSEVELERPFADPRSKFYTWSAATQLAMDYRWTGAGRGAYEQAFTPVYDRGGMVRFPWVENGYLQAMTDWGVPVAILLVLLAGWSGYLALRRLEPDPLAAGALGGILALAVHECADFSVELPGVALPALAVLATLFARRHPDGGEPTRKIALPRIAWLLAPLALVVVTLVAASMPRAETVAMDLRRDLRDPTQSVAELLPRAEAARRAHPADFYLHAIVAERLAREHRPEAMSWLNDAMFLNPSHPAPHLMTAELLASAGRKSQALIEYKAAVAASPAPERIWDRVAARYAALSALEATLAPDDVQHLGKLGNWLQAHHRPAEAVAVYERVLALDPHDVAVQQELVRLSLLANDLKKARQHVDLLVDLDHGTRSQLLAAQTSIAEGKLDQAAHELDELAYGSPGELEIELALVRAYGKDAAFDKARQRLQTLRWANSRKDLIRVHESAAEIERLAGHDHQSEWELEQAARLKRRTSE